MPSQPPFDRSVALACTLRTFRSRWLFVQCAHRQCGNVLIPIKAMLAERPERVGETLADAVVRIRCGSCKRRPAAIALLETHYGHLGFDTGGPQDKGWRLELHSI